MSLKRVFAIGKVVVAALGPALSTQVPMAPDLRVYATWLSGVAAIIALVVAGGALSSSTRSTQWVLLWMGVAVSILAAISYVVVNFVWTNESGNGADIPYMVWVVGSYASTWGGLTFISAIGEKLADKRQNGPATR